MQVQNKNIFIDLDETLIHTDLNGMYKNDTEAEKIVIDGIVYLVKIRPGALNLLKGLRKKGDVYMLTRATADYAFAMSNKFKFGFEQDQIYSREYVKNWKYKELKISKGNNYLLDDLPFEENYEKIALLKQLGDVKYIKVNPYYGSSVDNLVKEDIKDILKEI